MDGERRGKYTVDDDKNEKREKIVQGHRKTVTVALDPVLPQKI